MTSEDAFVEKVSLHNKLVQPDQMAKAKQVLASSPGKSLLAAMKELGFVNEAKANAILGLYEKNKAKTGGAPAPRPAAAPPRGGLGGPAAGRLKVNMGGDDPEPSAPSAAPAASHSPAPAASHSPSPVASGFGGGRIAAMPKAEDNPGDAPYPPVTDDVSSFTHIHQYLGYGRKIGASDLHITPGSAPVVRRFGRLGMLKRAPFTPEETEQLVMQMLTKAQRKQIAEEKSLDFCYRVKDQGRYRSCTLRQRTGYDGAFRIIPQTIPSFQELGMPNSLMRLTEFHQGLVLITGPSGCGKSTTLAAMVELVNLNRDEHIITVEDPVEYTFESKKCQVNQRELHTCTRSFDNALRAALREDPDVIMIGEMRDRETTSLAITAAETGHLVFGTLHTTSAAATIDRILDVFPPDEQGQIRSMISESIKGIICQQLIPRKDGKGRALALEILFNNPAVGNLIRERKMHQMPSVMQTGKKQGMVLMDNSLEILVQQGVIEGEEAYWAADNKQMFKQFAPRVGNVVVGG